MSIGSAVLLTIIVALTGVGVAAEPLVVPVWPERDAAADIAGERWTERSKTEHRDRSVTNVRWPTLSLTLPAAELATGAAVVICPGGGYGSLAIDKEGFDVATWLAEHGIAGIVLKYRLPRPEQSVGEDPWPVQDVQRALRLVRSRAGEWRIDPARIGVMGFSAGGHLASTASTHIAAADPAATDPLLKQSSRPDFTILAYPVVTLSGPATHTGSRDNLLGKGVEAKRLEAFSPELQINAQSPPAFLVHAADDGVKVANSELYVAALKAAGVPCEFMRLEKGGHGFGLGIHGGEPAAWPEACLAWLKTRGLLDRK